MPDRDASAATQAILELLAGHQPADRAEAESLAQIRSLVADSPDPWSRHQYEPGHLTASAVVIDPERRRILLVFHEKLLRWVQPGGHFEPGEWEPTAAAAREALEETGMETRGPEPGDAAKPPLLDVDVHFIPARQDEPEHRHFDLRFLLVAEPGRLHAREGTADYLWAAPSDLAVLNLDPNLRRALAKIWDIVGSA